MIIVIKVRLAGVFMSFDKKKRDNIKKYILDKMSSGNKDYVNRAVKAFGISSTSVYRYLSDLESEGIIVKNGSKYELKTKIKTMTLSRNAGELKDEQQIYNEFLSESLSKRKDNVRRIWGYAFTEMMNNAIDHSAAEKVNVILGENHVDTFVVIYDNGVGIFRKIMEHFKLDSLKTAAGELFKGKFTTDSKRHSGEGIFFTSRMLDEFAAISEGVIFTHEKYDEIVNDLENIQEFEQWKDMRGTIIFMKLSNNTRKKTKEIFDKYADVEEGFVKISVKVKNLFDEYPVSRSQGKRLVNGFERYETVELDFSGIDEMGQGFADEVFRVFANEHPSVRLIPVKMGQDVEKMYKHVVGKG